MADTDLAFELTGCQVVGVEWPARGFRLRLAGQTAEGRSVEGGVLVFDAVANQYQLRQFLSVRRRIVLKAGYENNTCDDYPLKLPATPRPRPTINAGCFGRRYLLAASG